MIRAPRRVAFLEPELSFDPSDDGLAAAARLFLHVAAFQWTVRHPELAVTDVDDGHVHLMDGAFVPMHALRVPSNERLAFDDERRDEILWLDLPLATGSPARARLRVLRPDESERSYDAVGGALGDAIGRCLDAWLADVGLAPLPRRPGDFDRDALLATLRALAPVFAERAAAIESSWSADEPEDAWRSPTPSDEAAPDDGEDGEDETDETAGEDDDAIDPPKDDGSPAPLDLAALPPGVAPALRVVALRSLAIVTGAPVEDAILAIDPDDPWALRDRFFATLDDGRDYLLLRRCIAAAPAWGKPWLSLFVPEADDDDDRDVEAGEPSEEEELAAFAWAALCMPANEHATGGYADRLNDQDRDAEALRWHARVVAQDDGDAGAWRRYLDDLQELDRPGAYLREGLVAGHRARAAMAEMGWVGSPDLTHLDLEIATAYLNVGRIGEAIALRANRLEGFESTWRNAHAVLATWRSSAALLAQSYAREGFYRGDDARVLEGFSRAAPGDGLDLAMLLDALVARGCPREALWAHARFGLGRDLVRPVTRVAAARAAFAAGHPELALDELALVELRWPTSGLGAAVAHALRAMAGSPPATLDAVVARHAARGARSVARLIARAVADFAPGGAALPAVRAAIGPRDVTRWDPAVFDRPPRGADRVDALFAGGLARPEDAAAADALVDGWPDVVEEIAEGSEVARARAVVYTAARAIHAYLGGEARALAGGAARTVAHEALLDLARRRVEHADASALLGAIDHAAETAESGEVARWLVRVEGALLLEERTSGRVDALVADAPRVAPLLLHPERVALLERALQGGFADPREAHDAHALHFWATGGDRADAWSALARDALPPVDALDVHLLCAFVERGYSAAAAVDAARALFALGKGDDALDVLCDGLGSAGEDWRDARLAELAGPFKKAKLDVPFAFDKAASRMFERLQKGDPQGAIRAGRWCVAIEEDNAEAHRNLGLAYANVGDVPAALAHLERWAPAQSMQVAVGTLFAAGHGKDALALADFASQWFTRADEWVTYAAVAYQAEDNPRTALAYDTAWALDPDAIDASNLNAYATVLAENGEFARARAVAEHMERAAGKDALWTAFALQNRAVAEMGLGRFDEALATAKKAKAKNPGKEHAATFDDTLTAAKAKRSPPVRTPAPYVSLADRWFGASGEAAEASSILGSVRRARARYDSERDLVTTPRMVAGARAALGATRGATGEPALARSFALDLRATALFPLDPLPPLGDRLDRAELWRTFRERGGIVLDEVPAPPIAIDDRDRFPGTPAPRVRDLARILRALASGPPLEALAGLGLDEGSYDALTAAWAAALAHPDVARSLEAALAEQSANG